MEGQKATSMSWLGGGRCPFRGYPHHYQLDDRCPPTAFMILVDAEQIEPVRRGEERDFEKKQVQLPHPVLLEDSDCFRCVYGLVREKEAGLHVKPDTNPLARLAKRRRSPRRKVKR